LVGEGGADVNAANKDGNTAVILASQGGHLHLPHTPVFVTDQ
jgi:ankyrin repeat protein